MDQQDKITYYKPLILIIGIRFLVNGLKNKNTREQQSH